MLRNISKQILNKDNINISKKNNMYLNMNEPKYQTSSKWPES